MNRGAIIPRVELDRPRLRAVLLLAVALSWAVFGAYDGHLDWPASSGAASSALRSGSAAFWGNPGAVSTEEWSSSVFVDREWGLAELTTISLSAVRGFSFGDLSAGGSYFGSRELYSETVFGIGYSRKLWRINSGARLSVVSAAGGDWKASAPIVSLGAVVPAGELAELHLWADNISASKLDGSALPIRGAVGAVFKPTGWARLVCDIYSQSPNPSSVRFGQEVFIFKTLKLRCGVAFRPNTYHLGLGLRAGDFQFDWAYIGHPELGGSSQLGLVYER